MPAEKPEEHPHADRVSPLCSLGRMGPAAAISSACILARFQSRYPSALEVAGIPGGDLLKNYRTARSAFPAGGLDLAGPCRDSGKNGLE